jgi:hypothetical protein
VSGVRHTGHSLKTRRLMAILFPARPQVIQTPRSHQPLRLPESPHPRSGRHWRAEACRRCSRARQCKEVLPLVEVMREGLVRLLTVWQKVSAGDEWPGVELHVGRCGRGLGVQLLRSTNSPIQKFRRKDCGHQDRAPNATP